MFWSATPFTFCPNHSILKFSIIYFLLLCPRPYLIGHFVVAWAKLVPDTKTIKTCGFWLAQLTLKTISAWIYRMEWPCFFSKKKKNGVTLTSWFVLKWVFYFQQCVGFSFLWSTIGKKNPQINGDTQTIDYRHCVKIKKVWQEWIRIYWLIKSLIPEQKINCLNLIIRTIIMK